jgi:hypothetical protein
MSKSWRWVLALGAAVVLLPIPSWMLREGWRAHTLLVFCNEARVGMSLPDLLGLERHRWIDNSYLVQALSPDFVDQVHSLDLDFRSHMFDPDFQCSVTHDGTVVTSVRLLK